MIRKCSSLLLVAAALTVQMMGGQAQAALTAAGPVNSSAPGAPFPANGLPAWYQDSNGLALQGCLDNTPLGTIAPMCVLPILREDDYDFHLPIAYNGGLPGIDPVTQLGPPPGPTAGLNGGTVNYPSETFFYYASSNPKTSVTIGPGPTGLTGQLFVLMAVEGAYVVKDSRLLSTSPPADPKLAGNPRPVDAFRSVFQRFRIDLKNPPVAGTYTLTHPWGKIVFNCPTAGAILCKSITDIPLGAPLNFLASPDPALGQQTVGSIGPFMVSANPLPPATPAPLISNPAGHLFIGNPTTVGTKGVIPGNCPTCNKNVDGFSILRVDGPAGSGLTTGDITEFFIGGQVLGLQAASPAAGTDYGLWRVGAAATAKTFTVTNMTGVAATLNPLTSSSPAFTLPPPIVGAGDHCSGVTLNPTAPGNTCTFDVVFTPTANGAASGTIPISAPGDPPATVAVKGAGDNVPPTLTIGQISRMTQATTQTISGTMADNNGISAVTVAINGGAPQTATVTGTTSWSFNVAGLNANAANTVAVTASDTAQPAPGNQTTVNDTITADTIPPAVAITPVASPAKQTSLTISGTATDANGVSSVAVSVNGTLQGTATVTGTTWSFFATGLIPNVPTPNTISVTASDPAGNVSAPVTAAIPVVIPNDGDVNTDGKVDIADALMALRIAVGLITPTATNMLHGDVAPLVNGVPAPDGKIDVSDALLILRKVVGLVTF